MEQIYDPIEFRKLVEAELSKRKFKNIRYSLRKFALELDIPPGRLSEILNGKRLVSNQLGTRLMDRLALSPSERAEIKRAKAKSNSEKSNSFMLSNDVFAVLADWPHYALLNLIQTKDFVPNEQWIGSRLNLSPFDVKVILSRLERLGLIERQSGKIFRTRINLTTLTDIRSNALRRAHKQHLECASNSLDEISMGLRDMTSITMAIDSSKLNLAKKRIAAFRKEMASLLETGYRDEVYNLCISFYPLTRRKK